MIKLKSLGFFFVKLRLDNNTHKSQDILHFLYNYTSPTHPLNRMAKNKFKLYAKLYKILQHNKQHKIHILFQSKPSLTFYKISHDLKNDLDADSRKFLNNKT